jgi:chromosome segregation ATPase
MAQDSEKSRYSVTLSPELASLLKDQAKTEEKSLSMFLAQIVEEHYAKKKTLADCRRELEALRASSEEALELQRAEYESKIMVLRTEKEKQAQTQREECAHIVQRVRDEHEKHTQKLIAEREEEIKQIRADCEKQIQQINADNSASMQQIARSHEELETVTQKLDTNLKKAEGHNRSLMEELQQSEASKNTVVTGLQHEIELLRQQLANTEAALHTERGHLSELRKDKETLQKQLELVTLRLPAPKVGFWSRIFGGRTKED